MGSTNSQVSFLFVDDRAISRINAKYLGRPYPTDVISFPQDHGGLKMKGSRPNLGDVVISVERAKAQAKEYKTTLAKELDLLIVHGVLHLLNYRDKTSSQKRRMRSMEKRVLERIVSI